MPYDANLDETLYSKEYETEDTRITVSVRAYNQGEKKLQLSRENKNAEGDYKFAKLGRMVKDETEAVIPLIQEALAKM